MKSKNLTLAGAFEAVALNLKESELTGSAFAKVADETSYIKAKLRVTPTQAFILAVMLHHMNRIMQMMAFATFAKVSPIRILALQKDFDRLAKKGYIVCTKSMTYHDVEQTFALSAGIIQAVKYDKRYSSAYYKKLTPEDVLHVIKDLIWQCDHNEITYPNLETCIDRLIADTQHVDFCRKIQAYGIHHADLILFLIAVVCLVSKGEELVTTIDFDDILPVLYRQRLAGQFRKKTHLLCANGLMEAVGKDFDVFRLTDKARTEILQEYGVEKRADTPKEDEEEEEEDDTENKPAEVSEPPIIEKKLFYNPAEQEQVERLKSILSQERFEQIQHRLRAAGMHPGFACLFYGGPGTGKTETVLQLARATGRSIVRVNVATLRDKFVGESEKNIQNVFDEYKEQLEEADAAPILLFNEADGIFGNRYTGINSAVDQMENTIQNIILQNMETFEGILIATTNLTDNFDKAFERRFLFKICFEKPCAAVRAQIWMSVLPPLTPEDATILATRYDFSGSMIENVARRLIIDEMLYDRPMTLDMMKQLCDEEQIRRPISTKKWRV